MRTIPLSKGLEATVSVEDYEYLMQWKWYANNNKGLLYAVRTQYFGREKGKQKKKQIRMHRVILARKLGHENFEQVDHIDGNGLHNDRSNLRSATKKENMENRGKANKNSKTGILGVSFQKSAGKWHAQINHHGKKIHLGFFNDIHKAEQAVIAARRDLYTHHRNPLTTEGR